MLCRPRGRRLLQYKQFLLLLFDISCRCLRVGFGLYPQLNVPILSNVNGKKELQRLGFDGFKYYNSITYHGCMYRTPTGVKLKGFAKFAMAL